MATDAVQKTTRQPVDSNGNSIPVLKLGDTEKVATTAQSTAATEDKVVRIVLDDDGHIAIGSDPTATTSDIFMPLGHVEYIALDNGEKISVLGANMYVTDAQ